MLDPVPSADAELWLAVLGGRPMLPMLLAMLGALCELATLLAAAFSGEFPPGPTKLLPYMPWLLAVLGAWYELATDSAQLS